MSLFPDDITRAVQALIQTATARGARIVAAESCTGGLLSGAITEIAGSSDVFERGWITYSNTAKTRDLNVPAGTLNAYGAVSEPVAAAMAEGARALADVELAIAVTGVAGPGGGSAQKPVGMVCFAAALLSHPTVTETKRFGDIGRTAVRLESVRHGLAMLLSALDG